jgi:hypothetical protein
MKNKFIHFKNRPLFLPTEERLFSMGEFIKIALLSAISWLLIALSSVVWIQ